MKSYFAYTRVSTAKQGEHGSSLQEQKSAIEAYAGRYDLPIIEWFEETETAAKLGRRMFNRMLAELEKGRAGGVLIHKIDRSARNLKDWAHLGELIDRGIEVHFAHESLDLNSRGGRLSADIQAVVAADYIRNLRQEVRKGFYGRLKQGFYPLPAPIGYEDRGKAKCKEPHPTLAPLVRQMFELYATGRYSLDMLREEMHRRGLSGPTGRPLSKNGIARTLHNPFYTGIIRIERTGETFEGRHQAIVPAATFDRVQAVLSGKTFAYTVKHGHTYRRLIRCARCGRSLVGERHKGHVYYRCQTRRCGTSLRDSLIDQSLSHILQKLTFSDSEMGDLRDLAAKGQAAEAATVGEQRAQLQRALGLTEDRLTRLTDAFLDGHIDKETFETRKIALFEERARLRDALAQPNGESRSEQLLKNLELGNKAYLSHMSGFEDEKREAVEMLTLNLTADGKNLTTRLRFPFDEVEKRRNVLYSAPCWTRTRTFAPSSEPAVPSAWEKSQLRALWSGLLARAALEETSLQPHKTSPTSLKSELGH